MVKIKSLFRLDDGYCHGNNLKVFGAIMDFMVTTSPDFSHLMCS